MDRVGYLLYSGSPYRLWFGFGLGCGVKNQVQGNGLHCDRLLREAEKQLAAAFGSPPVESERELVQVVIEMLVANRSLVGSQQPPFEEGDNSVHSRHRLRWSLLLTPQECDVVLVALALQGYWSRCASASSTRRRKRSTSRPARRRMTMHASST